MWMFIHRIDISQHGADHLSTIQLKYAHGSVDGNSTMPGSYGDGYNDGIGQSVRRPFLVYVVCLS